MSYHSKDFRQEKDFYNIHHIFLVILERTEQDPKKEQTKINPDPNSIVLITMSIATI
jgi:hypothetical protein